MQRVSGTTVLGANAQNDNVLTGKTFEFSPVTGACRVYALTSGGDVRATIYIGTDLVADDAQLQVGTKLVIPDDLIAEHGAYVSERIVVRLRQVGGAGNVNVIWAVDFEPAA
jgi:hypothetical protein